MPIVIDLCKKDILTFENPKFGALDDCWLMSKRLKTVNNVQKY